jgi:hypothetical protein
MTFEERITTSQWMQLPKEIKDLLIKQFNLKRSGFTDVRDMQVVSDGFTNDDLSALTIERLKDYTGLKVGSYYEILSAAIVKLQQPLVEVNKTNEQNEIKETSEVTRTNDSGSETKSKRGKKRETN